MRRSAAGWAGCRQGDVAGHLRLLDTSKSGAWTVLGRRRAPRYRQSVQMSVHSDPQGCHGAKTLSVRNCQLLVTVLDLALGADLRPGDLQGSAPL
jgi:hypothetical protein